MIRPHIVALILLFGACSAWADDNRPLTVSISEQSPGMFEVNWKLPANLSGSMVPDIEPPAGCNASRPRRWTDALGFWTTAQWRCAVPLEGGGLIIRYPRHAPPLATIIRLLHADGSETTLLGQPGEQRIAIPDAPTRENLLVKFLRLGIQHIWTGFDHLLFVAGLIFVAGTIRRTAVTITGFTLAHSLTLALAALGFVTLPPGAIEAVIALSIVFLAVEIAKGPRDTLTWRKPVFVAMSFGLLHGFGFAAVLGEIGLPQQGLVVALFAFNLGIEIGQVLFAIGVVLALRALSRAAVIGHPRAVQRIAAYGVGILASYWMFTRLA